MPSTSSGRRAATSRRTMAIPGTFENEQTPFGASHQQSSGRLSQRRAARPDHPRAIGEAGGRVVAGKRRGFFGGGVGGGGESQWDRPSFCGTDLGFFPSPLGWFFPPCHA